MKIKTGLMLLMALLGAGWSAANAQSQKSISNYMDAFYNQIGINTTVGTKKSASPFATTNNGKIFSEFSFGYDYTKENSGRENENYNIQGVVGTNLKKLGGLISTDITKIVDPFFTSNNNTNTNIAITDSSISRQITNENVSSEGTDNQTNNFFGANVKYNLTPTDKLSFGLGQSANVMRHEEKNLVRQVQNVYDSLSTTQTVPINIIQNYTITTDVDTKVSNNMSQKTTDLSLAYEGMIRAKNGVKWTLGFNSNLNVNNLKTESDITQRIGSVQEGNVLVDVAGDSTLLPIYNSNVSDTTYNYGTSTNTANFGLRGKVKMDYAGNVFGATIGKALNSKKAISEYSLDATFKTYDFAQWSGNIFNLGLVHKPEFTEANLSHTFNVDWYNFLPSILGKHTEQNFNAEKRRINSLEEIEDANFLSSSQKELLESSVNRRASQEKSNQSITYGINVGRDAGKDVVQGNCSARFGPYTCSGTIGVDGYTQTSISKELKKGNLSFNYNYIPDKTSGELSAVYTLNP